MSIITYKTGRKHAKKEHKKDDKICHVEAETEAIEAEKRKQNSNQQEEKEVDVESQEEQNTEREQSDSRQGHGAPDARTTEEQSDSCCFPNVLGERAQDQNREYTTAAREDSRAGRNRESCHHRSRETETEERAATTTTGTSRHARSSSDDTSQERRKTAHQSRENTDRQDQRGEEIGLCV